MFDKASYNFNLIIAIKTKIKITRSDKITEVIRKIENNVELEIEEMKDITSNPLEVLEIEKTEELERKLRFLTVTNKFFRKLVDHEKEK